MPDSTESRIRIDAPPVQVMAVIADVTAYPEWNEEVEQVEVLSRDGGGRPGRVRFTLDAGVLQDTYVLDYSWDGDEQVSWRLMEAGILTAMDGSYRLTVADGGTEATYRLAVDLRLPMIGMIKRKAEKVVVDRALRGLKERVESVPRG